MASSCACRHHLWRKKQLTNWYLEKRKFYLCSAQFVWLYHVKITDGYGLTNHHYYGPQKSEPSEGRRRKNLSRKSVFRGGKLKLVQIRVKVLFRFLLSMLAHFLVRLIFVGCLLLLLSVYQVSRCSLTNRHLDELNIHDWIFLATSSPKVCGAEFYNSEWLRPQNFHSRRDQKLFAPKCWRCILHSLLMQEDVIKCFWCFVNSPTSSSPCTQSKHVYVAEMQLPMFVLLFAGRKWQL